MPNGVDIMCKCENPLCGYCEDDLFCPHCGERIAGLASESQQPDGSETIWVYPEGKDNNVQFSVSVTRIIADEWRKRRTQRPCLDYARDRSRAVLPQNWFEQQLPKDGEVEQTTTDAGTTVNARLVPSPNVLKAHGETWYEKLPPEGLTGRLILEEKSCPEKRGCRQEFNLRVCRLPDFQVTLRGEGVLKPVGGSDTDYWQIWRADELALTLVVDVRNAPVCFCNDSAKVTLVDPAEGEKALLTQEFHDSPADPTATGTILSPGQPLELKIVVDSQGWSIGEEIPLEVELPVGPDKWTFLSLTLHRVELSQPVWGPEPLNLGTMYFGEFVSKTFEVAVKGSEPLVLEQPEVSTEDGPQWIHACWKQKLQGKIEVEPPDTLSMEVVIDLTHFPEQDVLAENTLTAAITLRDTLGRLWSRPFIVQVTDRPVYPYHLAIDFGNTNTYAAVWRRSREGTRHSADDETDIVPLLDPERPETYPSILYAQDISKPNQPQFLVGREAQERSERQGRPNAIVRDLKRWVGDSVKGEQGEEPVRRLVFDEKGNQHLYEVSDLVRYLLQGVIEQSERRLRERIDRIGLSFPALFSTARVEALRQITEDMHRLPGRNDQQGRYWNVELDEATAAAFSFVLDPTVQKEVLREKLENKNHLVIASFDFGGGTIDTALMRFQFTGPLDFAVISNEFLKFGGDAEFGGDNVTVAVMELLRARLGEFLRQQDDNNYPGIRCANPDTSAGQEASAFDRENFRILWELAESIKKYLCLQEPLKREITKLRGLIATEKNHSAPVCEGSHDPTLLSDPASVDAPQPAHESQEKNHEFIDKLHRQIKDEHTKLIEKFNASLKDLHADCKSEEFLGCEDNFFMELNHVYDHPIERDLRGAGHYTVRECVKACVTELFDAAKEVGIDFLVLAGASCRLPLVLDSIKDRIKRDDRFSNLEIHDKPDDAIRYEPDAAKSKVAFGLVRALHLKQKSPYRCKLRPSIKYLRSPVVLVPGGGGCPLPVIPDCEPVDSGRWFKLEGLKLCNILTAAGTIELCRKQAAMSKSDKYGAPTDYPLVGEFRLRKPARKTFGPQDRGPKEGCQGWTTKDMLPTEVRDIPSDHEISIRLAGAEDRLELKIESQTEKCCYGIWELLPKQEEGKADAKNPQAEESEEGGPGLDGVLPDVIRNERAEK